MYDITFSLIFWISQENAVCKHSVYITLTYLSPRMLNSSTLLTFKRKMGWSCSIKHPTFLSKSKNAVPRWAFKLNGALAAAEHHYLIRLTSKAKYVLSKQPNMHHLKGEQMPHSFVLMPQDSSLEAYRQKHKFKVIYRQKPLDASCWRNAE